MSARNPLTIIDKLAPGVQAQIAALPPRGPGTPTASLADQRETVMTAVDMRTTGF